MGCQCSKDSGVTASAAPAADCPPSADNKFEVASSVATDVKPVQQAMAESPVLASVPVASIQDTIAVKDSKMETQPVAEMNPSPVVPLPGREKSSFEDAKEEGDRVNQSFDAYHSADSEETTKKAPVAQVEAPKPKRKNHKPKRKAVKA